LPGTNNIAYLASSSATKGKSFITLTPVLAILPEAFAAAAVVVSAAVALLLAPDCLSVLEILAGVVAVVPVLSGPVLVVVDLAAVVAVLSVLERMMIRCRRKATEHPFRSWCRRCKTFFLRRRRFVKIHFPTQQHSARH